MSVCLYSCPSYPECKSHLLCVALCYILWSALALRYFSTLNDKGKIFVKKNTERELCFDILYSFCLKHFSF
jgi:hypothetical protein